MTEEIMREKLIRVNELAKGCKAIVSYAVERHKDGCRRMAVDLFFYRTVGFYRAVIFWCLVRDAKIKIKSYKTAVRQKPPQFIFVERGAVAQHELGRDVREHPVCRISLYQRLDLIDTGLHLRRVFNCV
eukprot:scaffold31739_cov44-Attheya_sp.AAC.1